MSTEAAAGQTFELTIAFDAAATKRAVLAWLAARGVEGVVEGVIDGVDLAAPEDAAAVAAALLGDADATPVALFGETSGSLDALAEQLRARFGARIVTRMAALSTTAWQEAWQQGGDDFRGFETQRFRVSVGGARPLDESGKLGLVIERGEAFGDGRHATTQVALELLETLVPEDGGSMLDVGTGTGILAIAAARLGMAPVVATEIDAAVLEEARVNARANGVEDELQLVLTEALPVGGRYELICANILVPVLHALMPQLARALAPSGRLALAGFIEKDEAALLTRAEACGLTLVRRAGIRGWSGLEFRHR
jgi:ribosomal protein L11 methyltransferase